MYELENLRQILKKYQSYLLDQTSQNLFDRTKPTGNRPDNTNSSLNIIDKAPSRVVSEKRSDCQKDVYH